MKSLHIFELQEMGPFLRLITISMPNVNTNFKNRLLQSRPSNIINLYYYIAWYLRIESTSKNT